MLYDTGLSDFYLGIIAIGGLIWCALSWLVFEQSYQVELARYVRKDRGLKRSGI